MVNLEMIQGLKEDFCIFLILLYFFFKVMLSKTRQTKPALRFINRLD